MLALKTVRISPLISATMAKYGTSSTTLGGTNTMTSSYRTPSLLLQEVSVARNFIIATATAPFALTATRYFATSSSNPPKSGSVPSPPSLPDKQQLEKYFFRTVAFIWDVCYWLYMWTRKNFEEHVLKNQTVQQYWRQFHAKMEKSKRD